MQRRRFLATAAAFGCSAHAATASDELGDLCHAAGMPSAPFLAVFGRSGRQLGFVASAHSSDASSPTFALVRRGFDLIRPALVIVEGVETSLEANPSKVLSGRMGRGEGWQAATLAAQAKTPFVGGEPDDRVVLAELEAARYEAEDVLGALAIRALASRADGLVGRDGPVSLDNSAMMAVSRYRAVSPRLGIVNFSFSRWYQRAYGVPAARDPDFRRRNNPCGDGVAAKIIHEASTARNRHLLALIQSQKAKHPLLVVFGAGHFAPLAPPLTHLYGPPRVESAGPPDAL